MGPLTGKAAASFLRSHQQPELLVHRLWTLFLHRMELFTAQNGARKDATRVLIVITDGRKEGDSLNYDDVIPMAEAKGIIRYAIGVRHKGGHPLLTSSCHFLFKQLPLKGRTRFSHVCRL